MFIGYFICKNLFVNCVYSCFDRFSGKVHGSLARAGKVRGQTPKVAKQDKKKKPRGRAHKRMQYNRRFVTAGNLLFLTSFAFPMYCRFRIADFGLTLYSITILRVMVIGLFGITCSSV